MKKSKQTGLRDLAAQPGLTPAMSTKVFAGVQNALDDLVAECNGAVERNKRIIDKYVDGLA